MAAITKEFLLSTLPRVLADDEGMTALADGIADILSRRTEEINELLIFPRLRELPEGLLDTLAYDFKVDWWLDTMTLTEKRETLYNSWYVHRHMGTKAAVETALSAIYPGSKVTEWFDYDGEPYHFRLEIPTEEGSVDPVKHERVLALVRFYQNLRSVLDSIEYSGSNGTIGYFAMTAPIAVEITAAGSVKP